MTTDQIVAFTTAQIEALETADIRAMSMTQVSSFETEDVAVMTGVQLDAMIGATPIVLDLDGNGVNTIAASNGVMFDINATGNASQVGWVGQGDGLLVWDRNSDGVINDGRELFGGAMELENGQRAGHGYAALSQLDSNSDGQIDAADAKFNELRVWVDGDSDGVTDAGELKSLADLGILSMDLGATRGTEIDNGNLLGLVSSYTSTDGQTRDMADVWFQRADGDTASLADLNLGEVLTPALESEALAALDAAPVSEPADAAPADSTGASSTGDANSTSSAGAGGSIVSDPLKGLLDDQNGNLLI